jgi:ubiquinone/menaquinone biosynthesis C-methylase UbiE
LFRRRGSHELPKLKSKDLRRDYDIWHKQVHESDQEHDDASSAWYRLVREQIGNVAGLRILEVACGRGGFVVELSRAGACVTGCDFSEAALEVGRSRLSRCKIGALPDFVQGNAEELPFAGESFDVVVSCETIEHVPNVDKAVSEMFRVTRPNGRLFLTTPNYANFMGLYELYARFRHPNRKDSQPFDRRQWFPQVRGCVRRAGWEIVRTDGTVHQFPFVPGHNPICFPGIERKRLIRKILSPVAFHYFVIATRTS